MKKRTLLLSCIAGMLIFSTEVISAENIFAVELGQNTVPVQNKNQVVTIPDNKLRKILSNELGQNEEESITVDQLSTIERLDLRESGVVSIEGLQYCVNLKYLNAMWCNISDFSPLKNLSLDFFDFVKGSNLSEQTVYISGVANEDGSFILKNPCVTIDGKNWIPSDLSGGIYDNKTNTITWKNIIENHDRVGNTTFVELYFEPDTPEDYCFRGPTVKLKLSIDTKNVPRSELSADTVVQDLSQLFFQGKMDSETLAYGVSQEDFEKINKELNELKSGNEFYTKEELVTIYNNAKNKFDTLLPVLDSVNNLFTDGAHTDLKQGIDTNAIDQAKKQVDDLTDVAYTEWRMQLTATINKAKQLLQWKNTAQIDFYGIGTWAGKDTHFAQLRYNGAHTAILQEAVEMYGCQVHPYFEGTYASIIVKDHNEKLLFKKEFKGTDWLGAKSEEISLPEGSTLTIYHAEGNGHRYKTNNPELKQKGETTYHYLVKNNKIVQVSE
ncbi:toxin Cry1Ac domain D-VI-related protein [Enterococcus faecalis]|uniref:toxin Cry1Ac domain D-VI-related protein n=1 Tax=Enterococcus faecalis TaxID=1351 RepID=UPI001E645A74|nr:toxin Cry1Ac domain D-VI-related protein [Enterococcus faecalis]MCD5032951.1 hypothetical protein [Enterococcus faecalis]